MSKQYTSEELLTRFEDRREIINLAARYSADYVTKEEGHMFDRYWSRREDVCRGQNDGYYVGSAAVSSYYSALSQRNQVISELIQARFPEKLGGLSRETVYGVGMIGYMPLDTGVVEIAEDRQTAKAIWSIRGTYSDMAPSGPVSYWTWGWLCADLVLEDGEWRFWHMLELYDVRIPCGTKWSDIPEPKEDLPEFSSMRDFRMPKLTLSQTVRPLYHVHRSNTPPPKFPSEYRTFEETFSYGYDTGVN